MKLERYTDIIIENKYNKTKLNKFLFDKFKNINISTIQKAIRNKDILINNKLVKNNQIIYSKDNLKLSNFILKIFNSTTSNKIKEKKHINITKNELKTIQNSIIYKDNNIIAIDKPQGLAVQSGSKIEKSLDDYLPYLKFESAETPKLVHRIDKDTSGVIIIARNRKTSEILINFFKNKNNNIKKTYLTVVIGKINKTIGTINIPLLKKVENGVEKVYKDELNGKEAITNYKVLNYNEKYNVSIVEAEIITGRTHQIRVHFKEIGHPILGDGKYGSKNAFINGLSNKMHLHSYKIEIYNLYNKNIEIKSHIPKLFIETFKKLNFNFNNI